MSHVISYIFKILMHLNVSLLGVGLMINQISANDATTKTDLKGTQWQLVEFRSMDDTIGVQRPKDPLLYRMHLQHDKSVVMHLNCNIAKGKWSVKTSSDGTSGTFEFGLLTSTRAICPPPSMDQHIIAQAKYIRGYLLKDGKLYLSLMADGGIYTWEPYSDSATFENIYISPEEGGPRNWEVTGSTLNVREQPSVKANIMDTYTLGTILDNLGCQTSEGKIWCDVQKLGGGIRGYVASKYLKPAVSPDGEVARGMDDSTLRAGQSKFNATGTLPCSFSKGQVMTECHFGVARAGGGYATVVITKPDGVKRAVYFRMGKAIGADTTQADGYPAFRSGKESDWNLIYVGDEFYKIPDAVIFGGE